jgi:hypothetical protein
MDSNADDISASKKEEENPQSKKKEDTEESSDGNDGGWIRQREVNLATLQQRQQIAPEGAQEEEGPPNKMVDNKDKDKEME